MFKLKGEVEKDTAEGEINIEFGRVQAQMSFSINGSIQRKLKLKDGDKIEINISKQ